MADEGRPVAADNGRGTDRLEAFSDGVIAIAITLLIIEIGVPHAPEGEHYGAADLFRELRNLWPSYLGYLVSFLTIGIMWINHHWFLSEFRRYRSR